MEEEKTIQFIPKNLLYIRREIQADSQNTINDKVRTPSRCEHCVPPKKRAVPNHIIHSRLYEKYSSSQNYYYLKDINAILNSHRTPAAIMYKDQEDYIVANEVLKRFYFIEEYGMKSEQLTEYYKYHQEIPRIFTEKEYDLYFDYHDRKRKVEYVKITNKLKVENGEDPYLEKRLEMMRKRKVKYDPMLKDLSSMNASRLYGQDKSMDLSTTMVNILDKLGKVTSSETFSNTSSFSLLPLELASTEDIFERKTSSKGSSRLKLLNSARSKSKKSKLSTRSKVPTAADLNKLMKKKNAPTKINAKKKSRREKSKTKKPSKTQKTIHGSSNPRKYQTATSKESSTRTGSKELNVRDFLAQTS